MFRRTGPGSAVHRDGYEVHEYLPNFAAYREGDDVLRLSGELTGRKSAYDIILYPQRQDLPFLSDFEPTHGHTAGDKSDDE